MCKSRHWLLASSFWQGDKDLSALPKITAHPAQRESKPRKITASPSQICRIALYISGGTIRPQMMEQACWEERARRPEAAVSPWPHPRLLLTRRGLISGDGEKPGAHVRIRGAALVSRTHSVTSATMYRSNPPKGKQFEIGRRGERLPKGMKIILFHA